MTLSRPASSRTPLIVDVYFVCSCKSRVDTSDPYNGPRRLIRLLRGVRGVSPGRHPYHIRYPLPFQSLPSASSSPPYADPMMTAVSGPFELVHYFLLELVAYLCRAICFIEPLQFSEWLYVFIVAIHSGLNLRLHCIHYITLPCLWLQYRRRGISQSC